MTEDKEDKNNKTDENIDDNIAKFPLTIRERQRLYQKKLLEKNKPVYLQEPANEQVEPMFNMPPMTKNIFFLIIIAHIIIQLLPIDVKAAFFYKFSFVPAKYSGELKFDIYAIIAPITYMVIHGGIMHLIVNSGMLLAFGSAIEKILGSKRMLLLFVMSGIAGAFTHFLIVPNSMAPLIGASGGISGLFAALLVVMSRNGADKKKLFVLVAIWIVISLLFGFMGPPDGSDANIAWAAHLGGFFFGLALTLKWFKSNY